MASVELFKTWVHDGSDLDNSVQLYSSGRSDNDSQGGEVRTYANGRRRLITTPAVGESIPVTFPWITRTELVWLQARKGQIVLYRDAWGRSLYAAYLSLSISDFTDRSGYAVSTTFESITRPFGLAVAS